MRITQNHPYIPVLDMHILLIISIPTRKEIPHIKAELLIPRFHTLEHEWNNFSFDIYETA